MTRRGRPALDPEDPSTGVFVRIPSTQYDRAYLRASAARVSVPEWIRRAVREAIDDPTRDRSRPRGRF
jgi:predicted HicB family RNase H-like nuclease